MSRSRITLVITKHKELEYNSSFENYSTDKLTLTLTLSKCKTYIVCSC